MLGGLNTMLNAAILKKCINFVLKYLGTIYDGIFLAFLANKCRSTHQCFGTSLIDLQKAD